MPITGITISAVEPFAEGRAFGEAGGYVRVRGVAHGVLDPKAAENAGIADLDKAACNTAGLVEYATDFFILRPAEPRHGSGILVYDVTNRGSKRILQLLDDVPANDPIAVNDPKTARDAGLGFLFGRCHSIVWSGWDPGAPRANNGLGADFPVALEDGKPITGPIRDEFHAGTRGPAELVVRRLSHPAASLDQPAARLVVRDRESDRRRDIPRADWEFIDARSIRLVPEGRAFEPFKIYELWYEAAEPKVLGIGFASVRDLVSFLRYEHADNPLLAPTLPPPQAGEDQGGGSTPAIRCLPPPCPPPQAGEDQGGGSAPAIRSCRMMPRSGMRSALAYRRAAASCGISSNSA